LCGEASWLSTTEEQSAVDDHPDPRFRIRHR